MSLHRTSRPPLADTYRPQSGLSREHVYGRLQPMTSPLWRRIFKKGLIK